MNEFLEKVEEAVEFGGTKGKLCVLGISGLSVLLSLFLRNRFPFDPVWMAIILCGVPILLEAIIGLLTRFDIKADVLVAIALIAAVITGEYFAAGEVAFIMQLGELLEDMTVDRAREGIERLVHLTPRIARLLTDGGEKTIPAEEVKIGDILRVLPGETVPVDGVIISGETSLDQAVMTGESLPVDKTVGDAVTSGAINRFGAFDMKALRVGEDSSIQRMIRLVESADAGKAKIVGMADRWATWVVVIALLSAIVTWFVTHEIIRSVSILVVFCPCALVLATPAAIMAAIGNVAKHGFLVKEGDALERLAKISHIAFDKTGTLTKGELQVVSVETVSAFDKDELWRLAAAVEQYSEHPLGKAIVQGWKKRNGNDLPIAEQFRMMPGQGVSAIVDGKHIEIGNARMLETNGQAVTDASQHVSHGCAIAHIVIDGTPAGYLALSDTLREDSAAMLKSLHGLGLQSVLLTGDTKEAAASITNGLAMHEIHAECLPEDKLAHIAAYQNKGKTVCMIGDGVNDAPALKAANVGIALGGGGSDISVEAADIALIDDKIAALPHLMELSRRMMKTIRLNLAFSLGLNFLAILLAMTGLLGPKLGALVHNGGSFAVILNSALLLKWHNDQ